MFIVAFPYVLKSRQYLTSCSQDRGIHDKMLDPSVSQFGPYADALTKWGRLPLHGRRREGYSRIVPAYGKLESFWKRSRGKYTWAATTGRV
jgi:hypothetical protein